MQFICSSTLSGGTLTLGQQPAEGDLILALVLSGTVGSAGFTLIAERAVPEGYSYTSRLYYKYAAASEPLTISASSGEGTAMAFVFRNAIYRGNGGLLGTDGLDLSLGLHGETQVGQGVVALCFDRAASVQTATNYTSVVANGISAYFSGYAHYNLAISTVNAVPVHRTVVSYGLHGVAVTLATPLFVSGTTKDANNNFTARVVRVHSRSDGAVLGQAVSDAVTGEYSITTPSGIPNYVICLSDTSAENDLIFGNITPV